MLATCPLHHAQALLATTSYGVEGRPAQTPSSPQTGNLGLVCRTPLVFPTRRLAEELAKLWEEASCRLAGAPQPTSCHAAGNFTPRL